MFNKTVVQLLQSKHTSNTKERELKTISKHIKNAKNETIDWMTDQTDGLNERQNRQSEWQSVYRKQQKIS